MAGPRQPDLTRERCWMCGIRLPTALLVHPGFAEGVGAEQADHPELVAVRQAGPIQRLQAAFDEGQRIRRERRRCYGHLGDPGMAIEELALDHGPAPQPGSPVVAIKDHLLGAARTDDRLHTIEVATDGSAAAVRAYLGWLEGAGTPPLKLSTHRPSLDDVFLSLTGGAAVARRGSTEMAR
jgi:hypothetical protein